MYNKANNTTTAPLIIAEPGTQSIPAATLSPLVQFRAQPAEALVLLVGRAGAVIPTGLQGALRRKLGEHMALAEAGRDGGEASLHKPWSSQSQYPNRTLGSSRLALRE